MSCTQKARFYFGPMKSGLWNVSIDGTKHFPSIQPTYCYSSFNFPLGYVNQPNALVASEVYQVAIINNVHSYRAGRRLYRNMLQPVRYVEGLTNHTFHGLSAQFPCVLGTRRRVWHLRAKSPVTLYDTFIMEHRGLKIDLAKNKYNNLYSFRWKRRRKCFAVLTYMSSKTLVAQTLLQFSWLRFPEHEVKSKHWDIQLS
jgi:hypothetical protein